MFFFFFSSRRRHTRSTRDWSSDVCSSDLGSGRAACASGPGGSRRRGRSGCCGQPPAWPDRRWQDRCGGAHRGWCPTGYAWSLDLPWRRSQKSRVSVFGQLDTIAVPASPVPGLVPCHEQNCPALRVEDEQDAHLGSACGAGPQLFEVVKPRTGDTIRCRTAEGRAALGEQVNRVPYQAGIHVVEGHEPVVDLRDQYDLPAHCEIITYKLSWPANLKY